jgi:ubiquinone/menaquinone biosynthesis C-methylase UbiE
MASSSSPHQPNPLRIFEALNSYQRAFALKAAIDLKVFTHIAAGATATAEIAARADASEKGIRVLCDYLTIGGFLTKQNGVYGLTPDAAVFLDQRSPAYLGTAAGFLVHAHTVTQFMDLTSVVRKGGTAVDRGNMAPEADIWVEFARSMAPISGMGARGLAEIVNTPGRAMKVLDIAAGPGAYGIAIATLNPLAEIYAQDWKNVLALSVEHAKQAGVGERYHTIAGNAFEVDLGSAYDLVLLPNFLHHFDHPTNVQLLKRVRTALAPGGRVATVEFVPNDDRVSPPQAAAFSLTMLGSTERGDAYTLRELEAMFREAGFGQSRSQDMGPQTLILTDY